jgi:prepilin-type N-terminal cleavage/methylation domain-containing protein
MRFITKANLSKKIANQTGFTIIEVMIVLAIAGLIMAMLFIAVPELQASQRDSQRRSYARQAFAALEELHGNGGKLPSCDSAAGGCSAIIISIAKSFLTTYLPPGTDPLTGNSYGSASLGPVGTGEVHTSSKSAYLFYDSKLADHTTPISGQDPAVNVGQIIIIAGHWCFSTKPDQPLDTVPRPLVASTPGPGADQELNKFAVIIGTERGQFYCIDNY